MFMHESVSQLLVFTISTHKCAPHPNPPVHILVTVPFQIQVSVPDASLRSIKSLNITGSRCTYSISIICANSSSQNAHPSVTTSVPVHVWVWVPVVVHESLIVVIIRSPVKVPVQVLYQVSGSVQSPVQYPVLVPGKTTVQVPVRFPVRFQDPV